MTGVIPRPARARPGAGRLATAGSWRVRADDRLAHVADVVRDLLRPHVRDRLVDAGADHELTLLPADAATVPAAVGVPPGGVPTDETYRLTVTADGITCRAATETGAFRAATTAVQLLATGAGELPAQELLDGPRYAWRGLMIDPARGFVPAADVRRLIDLAALYKLNVLHLHLTDDEGWRIELPGLRRLTAGAAHYTAAEYGELQRYAAQRHVTIVPEIDLPGHCRALRDAFPGLPVPPAPPDAAAVLAGADGHARFHPPLDLTDPATGRLVERILAGLCALTAGPFVHIGTDEAIGMTERAFTEAVTRLRAIVREHGKQPLGWQESARAGVDPRDIGQFWFTPMSDAPGDGDGDAAAAALRDFFGRTADDLPRLVAGGARVLLSPQSHCYLDRPYDPATVPADQRDAVSGLGFPDYPPETVERLAAWDPTGYGIPAGQTAGIEATLFGESVDGLDGLTTLLLPRLPAIAETAWSGSAPDWPEYRVRLAGHAAVWRDRGLRFFASTEIPWPPAAG
ncbi:MAG TPA: family 20 glycosylhydrolase [Micromonosporaceae bacterium]|nr:family 20 glycosylhydrolase [Micromonosporaceae bacterium]